MIGFEQIANLLRQFFPERHYEGWHTEAIALNQIWQVKKGRMYEVFVYMDPALCTEVDDLNSRPLAINQNVANWFPCFQNVTFDSLGNIVNIIAQSQHSSGWLFGEDEGVKGNGPFVVRWRDITDLQ